MEPVPFVPAENASRREVHDVSLPLAEVVPDELAVRDLPEKADALAVFAVLVRESELSRESADFGLPQLAERKESARHLLLAQPREEVSLVLHRVDPALEENAAGALLAPRVVPRRHALEVGVDLVEERAELDVLVAEDVRARRPARFELGDGVAHHPIPVRALERSDFEGNVEPLRDLSREPQVLFPGTGSQVGELVLEPHLQVEGSDVVAFLAKKAQGDGAVHSPREQGGDLHGNLSPWCPM
jgi:hypothetical protein